MPRRREQFASDETTRRTVQAAQINCRAEKAQHDLIRQVHQGDDTTPPMYPPFRVRTMPALLGSTEAPMGLHHATHVQIRGRVARR